MYHDRKERNERKAQVQGEKKDDGGVWKGGRALETETVNLKLKN